VQWAFLGEPKDWEEFGIDEIAHRSKKQGIGNSAKSDANVAVERLSSNSGQNSPVCMKLQRLLLSEDLFGLTRDPSISSRCFELSSLLSYRSVTLTQVETEPIIVSARLTLSTSSLITSIFRRSRSPLCPHISAPSLCPAHILPKALSGARLSTTFHFEQQRFIFDRDPLPARTLLLYDSPFALYHFSCYRIAIISRNFC